MTPSEPLSSLRGQRLPLLVLLALGAALFMAVRRFMSVKILLFVRPKGDRADIRSFSRPGRAPGSSRDANDFPCGTGGGGLEAYSTPSLQRVYGR